MAVNRPSRTALPWAASFTSRVSRSPHWSIRGLPADSAAWRIADSAPWPTAGAGLQKGGLRSLAGSSAEALSDCTTSDPYEACAVHRTDGYQTRHTFDAPESIPDCKLLVAAVGRTVDRRVDHGSRTLQTRGLATSAPTRSHRGRLRRWPSCARSGWPNWSASSCHRSSAASSGSSFFTGCRSILGRSSAMSQLDWLISITAMSVLFCSRPVRATQIV